MQSTVPIKGGGIQGQRGHKVPKSGEIDEEKDLLRRWQSSSMAEDVGGWAGPGAWNNTISPQPSTIGPEALFAKMDMKIYETFASLGNQYGRFKITPHKDRYSTELSLGIMLYRRTNGTISPTVVVMDNHPDHSEINMYGGGASARW